MHKIKDCRWKFIQIALQFLFALIYFQSLLDSRCNENMIFNILTNVWFLKCFKYVVYVFFIRKNENLFIFFCKYSFQNNRLCCQMYQWIFFSILINRWLNLRHLLTWIINWDLAILVSNVYILTRSRENYITTVL